MSSVPLEIRRASPEDVPLVLRFIGELAEYERLANEMVATEELVHDALFGPKAVAEVLLAFMGDEPAGFALFFHNFSTFLGRRGIYLEDLYVSPALRGKGIGGALLAELAQVALERDCGRLEWSVLDWNESAIRVYESLGAVPMHGWTVYRLSGERLRRSAKRGRGEGLRG